MKIYQEGGGALPINGKSPNALREPPGKAAEVLRDRSPDDIDVRGNHGPSRHIIELLDVAPRVEDLRATALAGLTQSRKTLPCKLFYDRRGSQLFDQICQLPEYYPTRTELQITCDHAGEIARSIGSGALLVEYGSGSSSKTRILLDHLIEPAGYIPIDISRDHLLASCRSLADRYPRLRIEPICADYTQRFSLPVSDSQRGAASKVVAYFPGSTIGNFEPDEAHDFLRTVRSVCGPQSALLIGVDLKKDPAVLHAAYNDAGGVTGAFNLNLLHRLNRELGSNFDISAFCHYAFYNLYLGRVEMHLVSKRRQRVVLSPGAIVEFDAGESIHTENCYKYSPRDFEALAVAAGYCPVRIWTDAHARFSLQLLQGA